MGISVEDVSETFALYDESLQRNVDRSIFSVGLISRQLTISAKQAQRTGSRDLSTGRGHREDFYLAHIKSFGLDHRRHGKATLFGNGVMPAAGVVTIHEIPQAIEGIVLGQAAPGHFCESPAGHLEDFMRLVWSIRNAARFYEMGAQLDAPEVDVINRGRNGRTSLPVITNPGHKPRQDNGGTLCWDFTDLPIRLAII